MATAALYGGCTVYVALIKVDHNIPQEPKETTEHTYVIPHLENRTKWYLGSTPNGLSTNGPDHTISALVISNLDRELALV